MKFDKNSPIIFAFITTLFLFFVTNFPSYTGKFFYEEYRVEKVIDGDTIEISNGQKIRLIGINAPERGKYYYNESKKYLENLILNKKIRIEYDSKTKDSYGRTLAYIIFENKNINIEILKNGFAHTYKLNEISKYRKELLEAENYAIKNEIGIWKNSKYSDCIILKDLFFSKEERIIIKNKCNFTINFKNWYIEDESHNTLYFNNFYVKPYQEVVICITNSSNCDYSLRSKYQIFDREGDKLFLRDSEGLLVFYYKY